MALQLYPSEIYYSQDSINCRFSNGMFIGYTLDEIYEGRLTVSDIDPISVTKVKGRWVTWDNRRLWVFRHLERLGKCNRISVNNMVKIPSFHITSKSGGSNVKVRGEPGGRCYKQSSFSLPLNAAIVVCIASLILLFLSGKMSK